MFSLLLYTCTNFSSSSLERRCVEGLPIVRKKRNITSFQVFSRILLCCCWVRSTRKAAVEQRIFHAKFPCSTEREWSCWVEEAIRHSWRIFSRSHRWKLFQGQDAADANTFRLLIIVPLRKNSSIFRICSLNICEFYDDGISAFFLREMREELRGWWKLVNKRLKLPIDGVVSK